MLAIYKKALQNGVTLECTCVGIDQERWDKLMANAKRANKRIIDKLVGADTKLYNPYDYYRTDTHLIYVHSGIEHFYKVNDD